LVTRTAWLAEQLDNALIRWGAQCTGADLALN
jgi:hypothetical protein